MKRALIFILFFLTGCGFHLRGVIQLPHHFNHIAIINQNQVNRDLISALKDLLRANHIQTVDDPYEAQYWLVLEKDDLKQVLTNVSSSTTPRQYNLTYQVQFSLIKKEGSPLISSKTISITQQSTINNDRILGSNFEAHTIAHGLRKKAAQQILYRISRLSPE